ncbi:MAG TPA: SGNH/GDSL hydrolase family protein [Actinomycetota bacterium]|nr:SGNH/GDSL hydrolase family protein [Actinomycetota bacterium]
MALTAALACSPSDEEIDIRDMQRQAVQREYGISSSEMVEMRDGSRVLFFGDSITLGGVSDEGYVTLVARALRALYPDRDIEVMASGVEGDKVTDLLLRLQDDVLSRQPTHVVIYVGVNDVGSLGPGEAALARGERTYAAGLEDLVVRIKETGAWVMLCTPGVIDEDVAVQSRTNRALERYAEAARQVAAEQDTGLCDLRREFTEHLAIRNAGGERRGILTVDGLHLNSAGNRLVAGTMLRALVTMATPPPVPHSGSGPPPVSPSADDNS